MIKNSNSPVDRKNVLCIADKNLLKIYTKYYFHKNKFLFQFAFGSDILY